MFFGDFGAHVCVFSGAENRPTKTHILVDFWDRCWGPEDATPPQKAGEMTKVGVLPSRVLLL